MLIRLIMVVLGIVSIEVQAFEVLRIQGGSVVTVRIPEEDIDFYEQGEFYFVVKNSNSEVLEKIEIVSVKNRTVRFKCSGKCKPQIKKGEIFSFEEAANSKAVQDRVAAEKNRAIKVDYGYPLGSAYSGFDFAEKSYSLKNISGHMFNLQFLWRTVEADSEVRYMGLGFFSSSISGKTKTNEGTLRVSYEVTGISIPFGVYFSKFGDWQFGLSTVKRLPISQEFKIKAFGKTQKSQPTTNRYSFVDEIQIAAVYSINESSRFILMLDDKFIFPDLQPVLNFTTWGDRVGVSGIHLGYEYEI